MGNGTSLFYKFHSFNWHFKDGKEHSFLLDALEQKYFYLSGVSDLNDIFERKANILCKLPKDKKEMLVKKEKIKKFMKRLGLGGKGFPTRGDVKRMGLLEFNEFVKTCVNMTLMSMNSGEREARVCCFTKKIDNLLMWSHYADGMRGVCLEFDFGCAENNGMVEVLYRDELYNLNFWDFIERDPKYVIELHSVKSSHWSYEEEYRLIRHSEVVKEGWYSGEMLKGIVFGFKVDLKNVSKVFDIIGSWEFRPEVKVAFPKEDGFGVSVVTCEDISMMRRKIHEYNRGKKIIQNVIMV